MELILLVGLVALFAVQRGLKARLDAAERELDWIRHAMPAAAPAPAAMPERNEAPPSPWTRPAPSERAAIAEEGTPADEVPPETFAPYPEDETPPSARETFATLFERFVAGRLLIWIGGISLAVAGMFLVRHSIEIGLVTPPVRMLIAALFGLLLVAGGEAARSRPGLAGDPRIAQALVGAGILVLYAAAYGSLTLYALIGLGTAAALMVAITAAALALSLRHGAPTAVLGLVGGFLTPLLVGDPDSGAVPLLAYLALLDLALFAIARRRGWTWLAAAAVLFSFVWTGVLVAHPDPGDALAGGAFIVALGVAASLARPGEGRQLRLMRPAAIGLVQLALLVGRADLGLPAWALFAMLAGASLWLSTRRPELRLLPPLALLLALILLAVEAARDAEPLAPVVAAGITLLFAGFALPRAGGGDRLLWTAVACAAFAAPAIVLRLLDPALLPRPSWAGVAILLALGPAWLGWRHRGAARESGPPDWPLLITAAATLLLLAIAATDIFQQELVPAAWLLLGIGAAWCSSRLRDRGLALLGLATSAAATLWIVQLVPKLWITLAGSLAGYPALATTLPAPAQALWALLLPALLFLPIWRWSVLLEPPLRRVLAVAGGLLLACALYIMFKQIFALAGPEDFAGRGFAERTILTQALFLAGWLAARRSARLSAWLTGIAAARLIWFDLIVHNPILVDQQVGALPVLNLLLPAYLGSAGWLYAARRRGGPLANLWLGLSLAALVAGIMLMVRQGFQGALLSGPGTPRGEFYSYSLAGLLLSIALLAGGIRLPDKALRVAGLALLTATVLKVFLIDAAALGGVLRILSFLGLGIALIGVGKLYARILDAEAVPG